ncbi:hypothetical protein QUB17_21210 [Microcoleus sp. B5-C4]|uniref:hypothetical protein n=1 Tax=Microcoleus sp. B5-C4 TaxID=2818675 RepID=UPI002FD0F089
MHKFKWQQRTKRFILALVSLLTLIGIVITGAIGYAVTPEAAYIVKFEGNGLTLGTGTTGNRQLVSLKDKLEGKKILYVPGGNKPWAHLAFGVDAPKDFAELIVKAGPHPDVSEWSFPCTAKGGLTIAWKRGSDRGCEKGIGVQRSGSRSGWLPDPNYTLQASRKLLKAQTDDEVTVVPGQGETVIQTSDNATGIIVDVLVGEVRVKSTKNSEGRLVRAGERYSYPQDTITAIDPNSILNSPTVQDFLNPNNWRSPDIPQRVADGIAGQLGELRTALGNGLPATASNSGNNNPGQSSTVSNTNNNNAPSQPPAPTASNAMLPSGSDSATRPTSATEFPLYAMIGVPTASKVQPLTFAPDKSLSLPSANSSETKQLKPTLIVAALNSEKAHQSLLLASIPISYSTEKELQKNSHIAQLPGINIPGVGDIINAGAAEALKGVINDELPIAASLKDAYPTVSESELPRGSFAASTANLQAFYEALKGGGLTIALPPGDYSVPVHVFCMKHSAHAPGSSETFLLAPLKGKQIKPIGTLNSRFVSANIDRNTIQGLSWAIQAGTKYEELSAEQKEIVDRLIPELKGQLSQSFWEKVESISRQVPGAPTLDSVIAKLGPAGELLRTYQQARTAIQQNGDNYSALERLLLLPGSAPNDGDSKYPRGIWSKISDRIYARLLPTGLGSPGSLDIRVLP